MRPLIINVPKGNGENVIAIALGHKGKNISYLNCSNVEESADTIIVFISNQNIESFIQEMDSVPEAQITLFPQGVLPFYPPKDETPNQVIDVELRSPIEIFLSGLQSIGSWKGFIGYSIITGIVVWIGLYTNTPYLLVGAMLIAPFAGPAMNTAIATSRGDIKLLKQSVIRYFLSLLITMIVAGVLSYILKQYHPTELMIERSQISTVNILLALSAGAAGALNLIQPERSHLVSGAAIGMLIAASLAPTIGIAGISITLGRSDMFLNSIFLIFLQFVGINFAGSIIFKLSGLSAEGPRFKRGSNRLTKISLAVSTIILIGLLYWQFSNPIKLQSTDISNKADAIIHQTLKKNKNVTLIDTDIKISHTEKNNDLLIIIYIKKNKINQSTVSIKKEIQQKIRKKFKEINLKANPFFIINVINDE